MNKYYLTKYHLTKIKKIILLGIVTCVLSANSNLFAMESIEKMEGIDTYITINPTIDERRMSDKAYALSSIKERIFAIQEQFPDSGIIVDLSYFDINEFPVMFFEGLANVVELDLHGNRLTFEAIKYICQCQLTNLKKLNLSWNQLTDFPAEIEGLINLQELDFSWNQLKDLSVGIMDLKSLRVLDFSVNQLTQEAIELICGLTDLEELNLFSNGLSGLSPEIGRLKKLQKLNLDGNKLKDLPVEIEGLKDLRGLQLSCNQLTQESIRLICRLTGLERLDLCGNNLKDFPVEIEGLKDLRILNLSCNQLTQEAIRFICRLTNLKELSLSQNHLTDLPVEILDLKNLQSINLFENVNLRNCSLIGELQDRMGVWISTL